jgi:hypothetical protein
LQDPNATIGQRDGFSAKDIEKLEKMYEESSYTTEENSSYSTEETPTYTTEENSSYNTEENPSNTTEENSSYTPRSQFITLIIITLNVLTHLQ